MWSGSAIIVSDAASVHYGSFDSAQISGLFDLSGDAELILYGGDFTADSKLDMIQYSIAEQDGLGVRSAVYDAENDWTVVTSVVPEPTTLALLGIGGVLFIRKNKHADHY